MCVWPIPTRGIKEIADGHQAIQARRARLAGFKCNVARRRVAGFADVNHELIVRQKIAAALGPFDDCHAFAERMIKPQLVQFLGHCEPVEVEMRNVEAAAAVGLHKRERRAWDLDVGAARNGADQGACESCLSRAQIAREGQHVARLQGKGKILGQSAELWLGQGGKCFGRHHVWGEFTRPAKDPLGLAGRCPQPGWAFRVF